MVEETGIEFFRRRLAEVEEFSTNLDERSDIVAKRTEVGLFVTALAIRQVADELVRFQTAFETLCRTNDILIGDKTRETLYQSRAALGELASALDTQIERLAPRHSSDAL